jgi:hypothetical protein
MRSENFKHFPTMPDLKTFITARNKLTLDAELDDIDRKMHERTRG